MMPFTGGIDSLSNGTLLFSAAASFFYLTMQGREPSLRRTIVKAGSIALLALLAMLEGGPLLLVVALLFCALGDALLAQDGDKPFLGGLASFLVGHLIYVVLFWQVGGGAEIWSAQPWRLILPAIAAVGAAVLLWRLLPALGSDMRLPVTAYTAAIFAMMLTASTISAPLVMIGAALFMVSDAILAIGRFLLAPASPAQRPAGVAVWVLYYLAQLAITLGLLL